MTILLFGGGGMLGREMLRQMPGLTAPTHAECDIADPEAVERLLRRTRPEVMVNVAAYTAVDQAEKEPELADRANHTGPATLARAALEIGVPLIHVSTDYVYDGRKGAPYVPGDPVNPLQEYGRGKLRGEQAIAASGCRHAIVRTQWLYGDGKCFPRTMARLMAEREQIGVVADQRGCPTSTAGLANALIHMAMQHEKVKAETYHYADAGEASWYELTMHIRECLGLTCQVRPLTTDEYPTPARRPADTRLDCSLLCKRFHVAQPDWRQAVADYLKKL